MVFLKVVKKYLFYGIIIVFGSSEIIAQSQQYSLDDIIHIARTSSTSWLRVETKKENNYWQYKSFKADYAPRLILDGELPTFMKTVTPVTQPDGNVIYRKVHNNTVGISLGLSQVIAPTGGMLTLYSDLSRYEDFIQNYSQFSSEAISIGLKQPIFQYNAYKWNKLIKPLKYQESEKNYYSELEQLSIRAVYSFFNLLIGQNKYEMALKNLINNNSIYEHALKSENGLQKSESEILQLKLNLVNSKLAVTQTKVGVVSALLNFKSFLSLSNIDSINLSIPDQIPTFSVDETKAIDEAFKNKSDVTRYKRQKLEAEGGLDYAKKSSGVNIDLVASYGLRNQGQSIEQVYEDPVDGMQIGIKMKLPLIDWGRQKARIKTAEANMKLVNFELQQQEETFRQSIILLVRNFNMYQEQVDARLIADKISTLSYDATKKMFLNGKKSITELNASQELKDNAHLDYVHSLRDYWVAYYRLRDMTLYDFHHDQILIKYSS